MKALVVGFGKMGMLHAATLRASGRFSQIAVSEPSAFIQGGLHKLAPHFLVFSDHHEALKAGPYAAAVVATPTHTHSAIIKDLVSRRTPVFVEKPLVSSLLEAQDLHELLSAKPNSDLPVMAGYCLRFVPSYVRARQAVRAGALGRILHANARMFSSDVERPHKGWRFERSKGGSGVLMDLGCHVVDLVRDLVGVPKSLRALKRSWYSEGIEDYAHAWLDYGAFTAVLEVSWSVPGIRKPTPEIEILGENGRLTATNHLFRLELTQKHGSYPAGLTEENPTDWQKPVPFDLAGPFYTEQMMEFADAVQHRRSYRNNMSENFDNHRILDAIARSAGSEVVLA